MTAESLCESKHCDVLLCCIFTFLPRHVACIGFQRGARTLAGPYSGLLMARDCGGPAVFSRGRLSFHDWAWTGRVSRGSHRRDVPKARGVRPVFRFSQAARGASDLSPAKPSDLSHRVEAIGKNPLTGSDPAKLSISRAQSSRRRVGITKPGDGIRSESGPLKPRNPRNRAKRLCRWLAYHVCRTGSLVRLVLVASIVVPPRAQWE
jgi:hypothetical protein